MSFDVVDIMLAICYSVKFRDLGKVGKGDRYVIDLSMSSC